MAGAELEIGARGIMRIDVDQVSQNTSTKQSTVRVLGRIRLASGGPSSDNTGNCKRSFYGDVVEPESTFNFSNLYTSWVTVLDETRTITHNADGTKSIWVNFKFGPTVTANLGSGGTVGVGLTLTPMPSVPNKPPITNVEYNTPTNVSVTWVGAAAPANAPVDLYQVIWWAKETPGSPKYVNVGPSVRTATFNIYGSNTEYSFQVAARNKNGWSPRSDVYSAKLSFIPTAPRNLQAEFSSTSTGTITFDAPASMGTSPLQKYQLQRSPVENFSSGVTTSESTTTSIPISGFTAGERMYIRVRAITAAGGGYWSPTLTVIAPSGPSVKVGNDWRATVAYVKVGSDWKVAVPYIYVNGQWRLASS